MNDVQVSNIKLSVKITSLSYLSVLKQTQYLHCSMKSNFIVIFHRHTYTIFKPSLPGFLHCNITKIKDFTDIVVAINSLREILLSVELLHMKFDNISATTCVSKMNLDQLFLRLNCKYFCTYNTQKFSAVFIKLSLSDI